MSSKKSSDGSKTPPIDNLSKSSTDSSKVKVEDKSFKKTYRSYLSTIIVSARAADKIAQNEKKSTDKEDTELKKAVAAVVTTANKMKSTATLMEEKLRGNTKEIEALQLFHRSQPTWCVAGRKRKFTSTSE